jgi:hypothetical protein
MTRSFWPLPKTVSWRRARSKSRIRIPASGAPDAAVEQHDQREAIT